MDDTSLKVLAAVKAAIADDQPIPARIALEWMASSCLNIQGAIFYMLYERPNLVSDLNGEITPQARRLFYLKFLERCLRENKQGEYIAGRYVTGHTLQAWFRQLWKEKQENEATLEKIRDMLANLGREGDYGLNDAIVTSILEHLFVDRGIREFFRIWDNDPALSMIYQQSLMLSSSMEA